MMKITGIDVRPYDPQVYGPFRSRRLRARVRFQGVRSGLDAERVLRPLLTDVYEQIARSPLVPLPFPERIRAKWEGMDGDSALFALHEPTLHGFEAVVQVVHKADPPPVDADAPRERARLRRDASMPGSRA